MRILLDQSVKRAVVERDAWDLEWNAINIIPRTEENPLEIIYLTRVSNTRIHLIDDYVLETVYFVLEGPGVDSWARKIHKKYKTVGLRDLPRFFESGKASDVKQGISYAALLAPKKFDKKIFGYFQHGFEHKTASVRERTIEAVGYLGWPQFKEPLQKLADSDPNADIRESAQLMLELMEKQKRGELKD